MQAELLPMAVMDAGAVVDSGTSLVLHATRWVFRWLYCQSPTLLTWLCRQHLRLQCSPALLCSSCCVLHLPLPNNMHCDGMHKCYRFVFCDCTLPTSAVS